MVDILLDEMETVLETVREEVEKEMSDEDINKGSGIEDVTCSVTCTSIFGVNVELGLSSWLVLVAGRSESFVAVWLAV